MSLLSFLFSFFFLEVRGLRCGCPPCTTTASTVVVKKGSQEEKKTILLEAAAVERIPGTVRRAFFFFACVHVCFVFCVCVSGLASRFIHLLFLSFYGLRVRVAVAAGASFFPCCVFRSRRLQDGRRGMRLLQSRPLFPRFSFPLTQCDPTRHDACPVSHAFLQELFHEKERVSPQQTTTNKKMSK